jgi:DNA-directed RNA polymerase specialized sigma24 family protein
MLVAERAKLADRASGPLSRRETQLVRLAIQGLSNNEIASRLRLSAAAVKRQLRSTFASLARRGADGPADAPAAEEPLHGAATDSSAAEATAGRE